MDDNESKKVEANPLPKDYANEGKSVESELSERVLELDTQNEGDQKGEKKQSTHEFPLQSSNIDKDMLELESEEHHLAIEQPELTDSNPYKNRILLLKKYTDSIMSEVKRVQSMSSLIERAQTIKLVEDECSHIVNLLKNILAHIVLGNIYESKSRTRANGVVVTDF